MIISLCESILLIIILVHDQHVIYDYVIVLIYHDTTHESLIILP